MSDWEDDDYGGGSGQPSSLVAPMSNFSIGRGRGRGRGGSKIKDLQEQSGARIKINSQDATDETEVLLLGSESARNKAKELIEDHLGLNREPSFIETKVLQEQQAANPAPRRQINWGMIHANREESARLRWADLPDVIKDFYIEHPEVANRLPKEVAQIRKQNMDIQVHNLHKEGEGTIPNPAVTFEECFEHFPEILSELRRAGFNCPSPIQMQAWPIALKGHDLIGIAQTGTGKTLAFLLPAFIHIEGQITPRAERKGPTVLVLSPTRELALQIESEVRKYKYKGIKCVCIYGGGSRKAQVNVVQKGVEIVVATPGRLNDLIDSKILDVSCVTYLVLDEADRMLDMGFEPDIRKTLLDIRPDRQTVMTSATWPEGVRRMAEMYCKNPMQVFVGSLDLAAVHSVTQIVEVIPDDEKRDRLKWFLNEEMGPRDKVIVFVGRKVTADDLASELMLDGHYLQCIHGDREQCDREQAITDMKEGTVRILIATDVASRGLDIKDITHVFNFDFPRHMEEYVHRVGRTGRAGALGTSITLMARNDWRKAKELIDILVEANQEVPRELEQMAERWEAKRERDRDERGGGFGGGGGGRGGFGGGGGGGGCYKCGQGGHFARECPNGDGGGGGGGRGGGGRSGGSGCHKCGQEGHFARECPTAGGGGGRRGGGGFDGEESGLDNFGFGGFGGRRGGRGGRGRRGRDRERADFCTFVDGIA